MKLKNTAIALGVGAATAAGLPDFVLAAAFPCGCFALLPRPPNSALSMSSRSLQGKEPNENGNGLICEKGWVPYFRGKQAKNHGQLNTIGQDFPYPKVICKLAGVDVFHQILVAVFIPLYHKKQQL